MPARTQVLEPADVTPSEPLELGIVPDGSGVADLVVSTDLADGSDPADSSDRDATRDLDETAPAADLMRVYLNEIGRTKLLSAEEEVELAKRIEAGVYAAELLRRHDAGEQKIAAKLRRELAAVAADGLAAKDHMLRANLRLVVSVA